jgi:hypothetical protein
MPNSYSDSATEDTRLRELANILARGVLRLRQRRRRTETSETAKSETGQKTPVRGLEVPAKTVLSVSTRVNSPETLKPRSTKC